MKWHTDNPPLSEATIEAAELLLGVRLPQAYRDLVRRYPGGAPDRSSTRASEGNWSSCIGALLTLDPTDPECVYRYMTQLGSPGHVPVGLIPVADDGGGNLICLDHRVGNGEPSVVYWQHELDGDEAIVHVARNFQVFLDMLEIVQGEA